MTAARILIVDDSEMNRTTLEGLVTALGHEPVLAASGDEALEIIRTPPLIDLVLLDILMPGRSGFEILQELKRDKQLNAIPIIMVTVVDQMETVVQCIEAGADDYLIKPYNAMLLKARINGSLDKKRRHDQEQKFNLWLANSYQKLQQAEEARDSLFKMIVHDMNNPLTSILGETDLLMSEAAQLGLNDKMAAQLERIYQSTMEIKALAQGILDIAKMEGGKFVVDLQPVDIWALCDKVAQQFQNEVDKMGGQLLLLPTVAEGNFTCQADPLLLERVFQNLLANAVKYGASQDSAKFIIQVSRAEDKLLVQFSDNGTGIDEKQLPHIFSKFYQGDRKKKGLGLGLAFCHIAIKAMGGQIRAENNSGQGASFIVTLKQ